MTDEPHDANIGVLRGREVRVCSTHGGRQAHRQFLTSERGRVQNLPECERVEPP